MAITTVFLRKHMENSGNLRRSNVFTLLFGVFWPFFWPRFYEIYGLFGQILGSKKVDLSARFASKKGTFSHLRGPILFFLKLRGVSNYYSRLSVKPPGFGPRPPRFRGGFWGPATRALVWFYLGGVNFS